MKNNPNRPYEFIFVQKNEEIINEYIPNSSKALMFSDLKGMSVDEVISSLEAGSINGVNVLDSSNNDDNPHLVFPTALEVSPINDSELEYTCELIMDHMQLYVLI